LEGIRYEWVSYNSDLYLACVQLRDEVLRRPLGQKLSPSDLEGEHSDLFLAATHGHQVVGCLVLTKEDDGGIRMRQVAVASNLQRSGIGTGMLVATEKKAREVGFSLLMLHARQEAVPFYERLGYRCKGEQFIEVGMPHRLMVKILNEDV
jgi:N-acetylglutamate synthase-like GNAT family acetyltransferase